MKSLELLAPVGKKESLYAAIDNGANAVYLGGKTLNARHYASNFSNEELEDAVIYSHLHGVKVYITVNILVSDEEMGEALDFVKFLYDINVDGIIVQDIGFANLVGKIFPGLEIHGSTQMSINNLEGAKFLYENGFTRVVLARETPLEEIKYISKNVPIELEAFIHGALCVSYSGQCLMSSMIGGRSGNRGTCAQPCRMKYSLLDKKADRVKGLEELYLLSTRDLNTIDYLEELKEAGIKSFKIEGRMKKPEYVAQVVSSYREAMDKTSEKISKIQRENLEQVFNRGFTKGLTFGDFSDKFSSYRKPNNRGVLIGYIEENLGEKLKMFLSRSLKEGDVLELELEGFNYKKIWVNKEINQGYYEIPYIKGSFKGAKIYRTFSKELSENLNRSYKRRDFKLPLKIKLIIKESNYPKLIAKYKSYSIEVLGRELIERSRSVELTKDRIIEQMSKTGNTIFNLETIDIELDNNCYMSISSLNSLRRRALKKLTRKITSIDHRESISNYERKRDDLLFLEVNDKKTRLNSLAVKIRSHTELLEIDLDNLDRIYLSHYRDESIGESLEYLKGKNIEVFISTNNILYRNDIFKLKKFLDKNKEKIDGISASNLGTIYFIKSNYDLKIHGDMELNIFNKYSVDFLEKNQVTSLDLSVELNLKQIEEIASYSNIDLSLIGYGYIPVMTMDYCPISLIKNCKDSKYCYSCKYRDGYYLEDRLGERFRLIRENSQTKLYNFQANLIYDEIKNIDNIGVKFLRLDWNFKDEDFESILKSFKNKVIYNEDQVLRIKSSSRGHLFKGIVD